MKDRDLKNVIDAGREEGREQGLAEGLARGREEGMRQVAKQMKTAGEPVAKIAAYTGLTPEQISDL